MLFCLINRLLDKIFHLGKLFSARANDTEKLILRVNTCPAAIGRGVYVKREHVVKGVILNTHTCELKHVFLHLVFRIMWYVPGLSVELGSINVGLRLFLFLGFLTIVSKILSIVFHLVKLSIQSRPQLVWSLSNRSFVGNLPKLCLCCTEPNEP